MINLEESTTIKILFFAIITLAVLAAPAAAGVTRSLVTTPYSGTEFTVALNITDLEIGGIVETLPPGFTYAGTSLPEGRAESSGQHVIFSVIRDEEITYRVRAPSSGDGAITGVWDDALNQVKGTIDATPVAVRYTEGGGSDGGPTSVSSSAAETPAPLLLDRGENGTVEFAGSPVTRIEIRALNTSLVTSLSAAPVTHPAEVPEVPGVAYCYLNLTATNLTAAEVSATIAFAVNRSWAENASVDPSSITLYRYDGNWTALTTVRTGEDGDFFYFEAVSPGFSLFAISATERAAATETPVVTETKPATTARVPATATDLPAAAEATTAKAPMGVCGLVIALGAAAAVTAGRRRDE
ncbi:MAG: PGF-pre-PGF domain-containing protein [Methanomicrobiaceae archaeon]|uniref:PGF-pre-PGF domain-containing protein n=1 Tax=Methanoculleus sp. TaxID=90427 RepID=UPI0032115138|nr:PGF-pre-PGF domain-containing protein [Methanomicrobiaceae archaeon]